MTISRPCCAYLHLQQGIADGSEQARPGSYCSCTGLLFRACAPILLVIAKTEAPLELLRVLLDYHRGRVPYTRPPEPEAPQNIGR
jgi:hypothetical protein